MQRVLSFEQTPALSIPLRFFLTAPIFAILAALLMLWQGPAIFASRWSPATLALTHLLTLGFLAMAMIGALIQILHVVAGIELPHTRRIAPAMHLLLCIGTLSLCLGFLSSQAWVFGLAVAALAAAFFLLLASCAWGMRRIGEVTATVSAIRLALAGLALAVVLGALAASAFVWPLALPLVAIVNLHAGWGLLAWAGLLIIGVAYQVVPMFQVTPLYPRPLTSWLARAIFIALALWTLALAMAPQAADAPADWLLLPAAAAYLAFAIVTLHLLGRRKRPPEAATYFWRTGMVCLAMCPLLWLAGRLIPSFGNTSSYSLLLGVMFIAGFVFSIVNGMLYKIVPFLVWYHAQNRIQDRSQRAPNVREVIADAAAAWQWRAHAVAVALLAGAAVWPDLLARPAALAFGISSCWLALNLALAVRVYRQFNLRISPGNCAASRHPG